jgi:hypothetical protein
MVRLGLAICSLPAISSAVSQVKIAAVSPKEEGFLRELTQQPSLELRYRFYESVH